MKIVTFCQVDESIFQGKHTVENFESASGDAQIALMDITSIFDFEENKHSLCKEKFVSVAIIDDNEDYDAFKNFGIDAWINHNEISKINELLQILEKRFSL